MPWHPTGRTAYITVRCLPETRETLRQLSEETGKPMAQIFDEAVALLAAKYRRRGGSA
jgi:predicted DNA-binding protein